MNKKHVYILILNLQASEIPTQIKLLSAQNCFLMVLQIPVFYARLWLYNCITLSTLTFSRNTFYCSK